MANEKFILYFDDKPIVEIKQEGYDRPINHKYVIYEESPPAGFISQASEILTKSYLNNLVPQSMNKWKRDKNQYQIHWTREKDGKRMISSNLNYLLIAEELRTHGKFNNEKFNLPPLNSLWLDTSLDMSQNFHFFNPVSTEALLIHDGTTKQQYGEKYPIIPRLDREGHIFTSFQPVLIKRIIRQRKSLIENSESALFSDWILDLRSIINDSVSLIDINLNQLYNKAKYSPEEGWEFNLEKLGDKNNRRIRDKIKWVRQITGKPLNIEKEFIHFNNLRKLRNHLNHFDPPTLVVSIEEATQWLNDILYIGQILIKIRQAINTPPSLLIIELICQKLAKFNPEPAFSNRLPINGYGYKTSIWPDGEIEE